MYSLFLDTHDRDINIALYKDGSLLDTNIKQSERNHSDYVMPMIDELLKRNNIKVNSLNEVLVINGPGSFTGVRIGVTIAKTLAYTLNIPIKVASSLEMYAVCTNANDKKLPIIRDLKGVYGALYTKDNEIIDDIFYKSNEEFNKYIENNDYKGIIVENQPLNFDNIYEYFKRLKEVNAHHANPIYVKVIEALKND